MANIKGLKATFLITDGQEIDLFGHMHKIDYDAMKVEYKPIAVRASMSYAVGKQNETLQRYIQSALERGAEMERSALIYGSWGDTSTARAYPNLDNRHPSVSHMTTEEILEYIAQCTPSRYPITSSDAFYVDGVSVTPVEDDAIPVEDDSVFSPRPEYVPGYAPVEMEEVDA